MRKLTSDRGDLLSLASREKSNEGKFYQSAFKPIVMNYRGSSSKESSTSIASMKSKLRDRLNIVNLPIDYNRMSRHDLLTAPVHYMSSLSSRTTPLRN